MKITIATIIIMTIWIPIFIWTEYKWKNKNYLFTKTFSSLLFLTIGILGHLTGIAPKSYSLLIVIALVFGLVGDVFLVYSDRPVFFISGLLSFLICQILYGALFVQDCGFLIYDLILFGAIVFISLLIYSKTTLTFGKMKFPVLFYFLAISFMYTMALSTLYKGFYPPFTTFAIVLGATLFATSDMVLAFNLFKEDAKPVLKRVNLGLYYSAQLILASSIITFAY